MILPWGDHQHQVTDLEFVTGARRNHFRWTRRLDTSADMQVKKRPSPFRRLLRRLPGRNEAD